LPRGDDQQQHPAHPGWGWSMVVTNDDDRHACYAKVIVMHTFDEVGVVDVDMHPPSKPKHPPSLPSLFTTFPSLFTSTFYLHTYWVDANHQVNPTTTYRSIIT
jgi:hypothetical protein